MTRGVNDKSKSAPFSSSHSSDGHKHHHRSSLKQKNKSFKARKSSLSISKSKGRTIKTNSSLYESISKKTNRNLSKLDRKNKILQQRNHNKSLSNQSSNSRMCKNILLISITPDTHYDHAKICPEKNGNNNQNIKEPFRIFHYQMSDIENILSISLICDFIVFVANVDYNDYLCKESKLLFSVLRARGFSGIALLLLTLSSSNHPSILSNDNNPINIQDRNRWHKIINSEIPLKKTIIDIRDIFKYKMVFDQSGKHVPTCMNSRSWLLSDSHEFSHDDNDSKTLLIYGHLEGMRGTKCSPLSANQLVHIPRMGMCIIEKIESISMNGEESLVQIRDSQLIKEDDEDGNEDEDDEDYSSLDENMEMEDGIEERDGDMGDENDSNYSFNNEKDKKSVMLTQKTESSIMNKNGKAFSIKSIPKRKIKVPKGTSAYQAEWLIDSENDVKEYNDEDGSEEEDQEEYEMEMKRENFKRNGGKSVYSEQFTFNDNENSDENNLFKDDPMEIEREDKMEFKMENENENKCFPDEVEIPDGQTARHRFHKYRGVQSLKLSKWESINDIPCEYGQIVKFDNFKQTINRNLKSGKGKSPFKFGDRVKITIKKLVSNDQLNNFNLDSNLEAMDFSNSSISLNEFDFSHFDSSNSFFLLIGLFEHEEKYSVINFTVKNVDLDMEIVSKRDYIAVIGFRTFVINPLFSEYSQSHSMNHRYLKSFEPGSRAVGSFYGPVTLSHSAPVLLFTKNSDNNNGQFDGEREEKTIPLDSLISLVGTGSLLYPDPDRCILKRITLSGHPFKIHSRIVIVRFMFDNPEDIIWFKPVELVTNQTNRRGHIVESLGTHGYMKCVFDGQIKSGERIALHLYKRVFPKSNKNSLRKK